jgi:glycosyltransferase involved in cell wall biosynthesis
MNFFSGSVTASRPTEFAPDQQNTTHLVLIPSYNTGPRLSQTVATIRRLKWPVQVIIDGSTDGAAEQLSLMAANDPGLDVLVLPSNQGKGAAILHGLIVAQQRRVTHVVTVDADGQHSADEIKAFVAQSRARPEAMVLGVPVFDRTAPAIRVAGHSLANFLTSRLTLGIGDSLFGFRVYPVEPLLAAFAGTRWMRRFDFDSEAAIRLSWQGVPVINLPTPVRYFHRVEGGVSHFKYVRDNLLLGCMYTRLAAQSLRRRITSFRR